MKHIFTKVVAGAMLLAVSAVSAHAEAAMAKIRAIKGTAQVSINGGGWTALKVNQSLPQGAMIRTSAESSVDVFLNNSVVRVQPDSTMSVEKLMIDSGGTEKIYNTTLNVKNGRILGNVKKLAHASKYEIKTPTGVAGIRGTDFDITVTPLGNGKYRLTISSIQGTIVGSAVNASGNLVTAVINTGETWNPDDNTISILPPEVINDAKRILVEAQKGATDDLHVTVTVPDVIERVDPTVSPTETQ